MKITVGDLQNSPERYIIVSDRGKELFLTSPWQIEVQEEGRFMLHQGLRFSSRVYRFKIVGDNTIHVRVCNTGEWCWKKHGVIQFRNEPS